jgi:hypothetical protein
MARTESSPVQRAGILGMREMGEMLLEEEEEEGVETAGMGDGSEGEMGALTEEELASVFFPEAKEEAWMTAPRVVIRARRMLASSCPPPWAITPAILLPRSSTTSD